MIKLHCERCDAVVDQPRVDVSVSRTLIEDKGLPNEYGEVAFHFGLRGFLAGGEWRTIDLCNGCMLILLDEARRLLWRAND